MDAIGGTHRRVLVALLALVGLAAPARATTCPPQPATLLGDTDTRPGTQRPTNFLPIGSTLYFTAITATEGDELWRSDGSSAGTVLVADIHPGRPDSSPTSLANIGGQLFFAADDGTNGRELWTSDGTPGGTTLVSDINPGPGGSSPSVITDVGGRAFFAADDGASGVELWVSDGTAAGTLRVSDINPGAASGSPASFADLGGVAYFAADDGISGSELWTSDGTAAGTRLVKDICPGGSSAPSSLVDFGGTLYFAADECSGNLTLWKSDGTPAGTMRAVSAGAGREYDRPSDLTPVGSLLYFVTGSYGGYALWVTDGVVPRQILGADSIAMAVVGGQLYIGADGDLMVVDGAAGTATSIADLTGRYDTMSLADRSGSIVVIATDQWGESALWTSDGTPAGTVSIATVDSVGDDYAYHPAPELATAGGLAFFVGEDAVIGRELWRSDGTPAGTGLIRDISPTTRSPWSIDDPTPVGGRLFFDVIHDNPDPDGWGLPDVIGVEPWVTDATPGGTQRLPAWAFWHRLVAFDDALLFDGCSSPACLDRGLWRSDGTPVGTTLVESHAAPAFPCKLGGAVYFVNELDRDELWKTDGTAAGTTQVAVIPGMIAMAGTTTRLFVVTSNWPSVALWTSDGSQAGTRFVAEVPGGNLIAAGDKVFLVDWDDGEIWASDGTAAGTLMLHDRPSYRQAPFVIGDRIYFAASDDGTTGEELWSSDGTVAGTFIVRDIKPGPAGSEPSFGIDFDGRLLFAADDGVNGYEPWISDGTEAGTMLLTDVNPGPDGSSSWISGAVVGCHAYFSASSSGTGTEVWVTDGTSAGTTLAADILPGPASSSPTDVTGWGGKLFLVVGDSVVGREPHVLIPDSDGDLVGDACDTCACLANPDADADGVQDDGDTDADGFGDACDPCPAGADADMNGDLLPDDADDDLVLDGCDPCPDEAPDDADGDSICGGARFNAPSLGGGDNCPAAANASQANVDGDAWGDACDACPLVDADANLDGEPDDADGDLATDPCDPCPDDAPDDPDGDGWCAGARFNAPSVGGSDLCPDAFDDTQSDTDGDTIGDVCDYCQGDPTAGAAGVRLLADLAPGEPDSYPWYALRIGARTFFSAAGAGLGRELWATDGSTAGTVLVSDIRPGVEGSDPGDFLDAGGRLWLIADDGSGTDAWTSDGTPGGTVRLTDLASVERSWSEQAPVILGDIVVFVADDGVSGEELWRSDGTPAGTFMLADIWPGAGSGPGQLTVAGGLVFFVANDGAHGDELWKSDGTPAGTQLVADINPGPGGAVLSWLTAVNGVLLFSANDGVLGRELWRSDGSSGGTSLVLDILPGAGSSYPSSLVAVGDVLYFSADDGTTGTELWASDGTPGGTFLVSDIAAAGSSSPDDFCTGGSLVWFSADDGLAGREPWVTDGTAAGTRLLADLAPGTLSSDPYRELAADGRVLFTAYDPATGREPYVSDGTPAGTRQLADIQVGPEGSDPWFLADLGNAIMMVATDGVVGMEPWLLELDRDGDGIPDGCEPDADGDGVDASAGDCDDTRADILRDAAPVTGLRVSRTTPAIALSWDGQELTTGPGVRYDVVAGPLGPGAWDPLAPYAGAGCLAADIVLPSALTPVNGSAWLVVRANFAGRTTCAPGTYGPGIPAPLDALDAGSPCP